MEAAEIAPNEEHKNVIAVRMLRRYSRADATSALQAKTAFILGEGAPVSLSPWTSDRIVASSVEVDMIAQHKRGGQEKGHRPVSRLSSPLALMQSRRQCNYHIAQASTLSCAFSAGRFKTAWGRTPSGHSQHSLHDEAVGCAVRLPNHAQQAETHCML